MLFKMLPLTSVLLLGACAKEPSSAIDKVDRLAVPTVKEYTPEQQTAAAEEMTLHCATSVPTLCQFVIDYGRMRDQSRVALGLDVDVDR